MQVWTALLPHGDSIIPSDVSCVQKGSCLKDRATSVEDLSIGAPSGSIRPNICISDWLPSMGMAAGQPGRYLRAWPLGGSCDRDESEPDAVAGCPLHWEEAG